MADLRSLLGMATSSRSRRALILVGRGRLIEAISASDPTFRRRASSHCAPIADIPFEAITPTP